MNDTPPPIQLSDATKEKIQKNSTKILTAFCACFGIALLLIVATTIGSAFGIKKLLSMDTLRDIVGIHPTETAAPPGELTAFDPVSSFSAVQAFAGENTIFTGMTATHVRSDGTLDLEQEMVPRPTVTYAFVERIVLDSENTPPVGAGVGEGGIQWQDVDVVVGSPNTWVQVRSTGGNINTQYRYKNLGMQRRIGSTSGSNDDTILPEPACSFEKLWSVAMEQGAPSDAVAAVTYDEDGYDFWIRDTRYRYSFDLTCNLLTR
jgi:hypothetical protein